MMIIKINLSIIMYILPYLLAINENKFVILSMLYLHWSAHCNLIFERRNIIFKNYIFIFVFAI